MIGTRLKELRELKGITQKQMSKETGININTLASYEKSNREPSYETLIMLSEYFGCTTDYMLGTNAYKNRDDYNKSMDEERAFQGSLNNLNYKQRQASMSIIGNLLSMLTLQHVSENALNEFVNFLTVTTFTIYELMKKTSQEQSVDFYGAMYELYKDKSQISGRLDKLCNTIENELARITNKSVGDTNADTEE